MIHEFGHYGLYLYDEYRRDDGSQSQCTLRRSETTASPYRGYWIRGQPRVEDPAAASVMDFQGVTSEFCSTLSHNPHNVDTEQHQRNGESCWETIVRYYQDRQPTPRWQIQTPVTRGQAVPGPSSIPVTGWMPATVVANANTGACSVDPVYEVRHLWGAPAAGADIRLRNAGRTIYQGKTDAQGEITLLGAANGDRLVAELWGLDLRINSTQVSCLTGLAMGSSTEIVLQPAPFVLDIAVVPTGSAGQAQVSIHASTALSGTPQVRIFQSGSTAPTIVPVAYDSGTQAYTGTFGLDPARPQAGDVEVIAEDTTGHDLQLFSAFSLSQVPASQDVTIYSADGQVELYLPAGSLSADGRLSIAPEATVGALPEGLVMVSGPYTIQAGSGITLTEAVALTLRYLDTGGTLSQANLSTVQVYRRGVAGQWVPLSSNVLEDHNAVSAAIDSLGTYAALAERQYLLYIPIAMRNH